MHKFVTFCLLVVISLSVKSQDSIRCIKLSEQFVRHFTSEAYAEAADMFDARMRSLMSEDGLRDLWNDMVHMFGTYQDTGMMTLVSVRESKVVFNTLKFEKLIIHLKLTFNQDHLISGLYYSPAGQPGKYQKPSYADYNYIKELRTTLISDSFELPAVLVVPKTQGPFPVVILVHGSGPQDMDESIGPNKPFKDLALGLASRGVAVFRYDKRSFLYGKEMTESRLTYDEEVTRDALKAIEKVKEFREVDTNKIFVLGHSLGGMLAPEIARRSDETAGIIMMAAPARSLIELMTIQLKIKAEQLKDNAEVVSQINKMLEQLQWVETQPLTEDTPKDSLPGGISAEYWLSARDFKQVEVAKTLGEDILIMHAGSDQQVFREDFDLWRSSLPQREGLDYKYYPGLNHMFITQRKENTEEDYKLPGHIEEIVVDDIAEWVKTRKKGSKAKK